MKLPFFRTRRKAGKPAAGQSPPAASKLRLGVIGPGLIWRQKHQIVLAQHAGEVEIVALCARRQETLDAAGVPGSRHYDDIGKLLHDADVQAVLVLTPIGLNASTTVAALEAGKDVFVEKPLGQTTAECQAVLRAEAASGKRVTVLEQAVYHADISTTRRLLAENAIGELILYDRIVHFLMDADKHDAGGFGRTAWRREGAFPLGALLDAGIHPLAQLTRLFGVPESVSATGRKWRQEFGEYDEVLMQFQYASGLRGVFSHSAALPTIQCGFNIRGTNGVIQPAGNKVLVTGLDEQTNEVAADASRGDMWQQILQALTTGSRPLYTAADAAQDVAILESVATAIRSGATERVLRVPDTSETPAAT